MPTGAGESPPLQFPVGGRPRRRKPAPPPIKVLGKTVPAGPAKVLRASPWAFGGAVMIELERATIGKIEEWQLRNIEAELARADRDAKRRLEAARARDPVAAAQERRARQSRAAEQRAWEQQYGAWEPSPAALPPPRTGEYYVDAPPRAVQTVDLPGPLERPPVVPVKSTIPIPPPTQKQKLLTAVEKSLRWIEQHPLASAVLVGALVKLAPSGGRRAAPPPPEELEDFGEGLTDFGPGPLISGTVGGVPAPGMAFDEAAELEDLADADSGDCEDVDPRRTPGQCRQGWFEESPGGLHLREWSRRPCQ